MPTKPNNQPALACRHRGPQTGTQLCELCPHDATPHTVKTYDCEIYRTCTKHHTLDDVQPCSKCPHRNP